MFFTNARQHANGGNLISKPVMFNPRQPRQIVQVPSTPIVSKIPYENPITLKNEVKMKWGQPTWFLFHMLAEKIKEEHFLNIKNELIKIIFDICQNLPCQTCATHATEYLSKSKIYSIQTKQEFKEFFFHFHNDVNTRKNYYLFDRNELDSKYAAAKWTPIINYFIYYFTDSHKNVRLISEDMYRQKLAKNIKEWLIYKQSYFNI